MTGTKGLMCVVKFMCSVNMKAIQLLIFPVALFIATGAVDDYSLNSKTQSSKLKALILKKQLLEISSKVLITI